MASKQGGNGVEYRIGSSGKPALPAQIKIGPYKIQVTLKETLEDGHAGIYLHGREIELQDNQYNPEYAVDTLMHEVLHSIYKCSGLSKRAGEEKTVSAFATALVALMKENPLLLQWIIHTLELSA